MKKYYREIILAVAAYSLLSFLSQWQGVYPLLSGLIHHLVILALAIVLGIALVFYSIRKEISILSSQHRHTNEKVREPVAIFMRHRLSALQRVRRALLSGEGLDLDTSDLERFVDACFSANRGNHYVGTDSNVPSRFYELYPTYLGKQFTDRRLRKPSHDVRILFSTEGDLRSDYEHERVMFRDFFENHVFNHVRLLQVEKPVATKLAETQHLPSTDVGVFGGRFVAFFSLLSASAPNFKYRIQVEELSAERLAQLRQYLHMLNEFAKEIRLENDLVSCIERKPSEKEDDERRLLRDLTASALGRLKSSP